MKLKKQKPQKQKNQLNFFPTLRPLQPNRRLHIQCCNPIQLTNGILHSELHNLFVTVPLRNWIDSGVIFIFTKNSLSLQCQQVIGAKKRRDPTKQSRFIKKIKNRTNKHIDASKFKLLLKKLLRLSRLFTCMAAYQLNGDCFSLELFINNDVWVFGCPLIIQIADNLAKYIKFHCVHLDLEASYYNKQCACAKWANKQVL